MRRRRSCWSTLALSLGLLAIPVVVGYFAFGYLIGSAKHGYYTRNYFVTDVDPGRIGDYPAERRLTDVPWFSTKEPYDATSALRMVIAQRGQTPSLGELNFLSGYSYGTTQIPDKLGFSPFGDPETGLVVAAPRFGLKRMYYVTNDEDSYLRAIRYQLSMGRPVRVALDMAKLYEQPGQNPHSELLIGYDTTGFEYYEPTCDGLARCQPGEKEKGAPGLRLTSRQLIDSVLAQSEQFGYPWKYGYTVFEPADSSLTDLTSIWQRNGVALVGTANDYGPRSGSEALKVAAAQVADQAERADTTWLLPGLEAAIYTRHDDAAFLRERFRGNAEVESAARHLDAAATAYELALMAVRDGIANGSEAAEVASALRTAADAERQVGETFAAQVPLQTPDFPPAFAPLFETPSP